MIKLGHINYLNCIPVHGALLLKKVPFDGSIVKGTPNQLNRLLELGRIDVSPSSSVEVRKGYKVLPTFSISSKVDVKSIILVTKIPLNELKSGFFFLTSHSATSSLLLKVILREFFNIDAKYKVFAPERHTITQLLKDGDGILYIGDFALLIKPSPSYYIYDLAHIWYEKTGLPFTFALWQLRKGLEKEREKLQYLIEILNKSYEYYKKDPSFLAKAFEGSAGMKEGEILAYWESLSFELKEEHIKSLFLFFSLAKSLGYLTFEPPIELVDL